MRFKKISSSHTFNEHLLKDHFTEGKNIVLTENGISSRPGVKLLDSPVIFEPNSYTTGYPEFFLTDIALNIDGESCRIAVTVESDGTSNVYYHFSALYSDSISSLGTITFTRTTYDSFPLPASFILFEGRPTGGSGIYFMARLVGGEEESFRLCELSSDRKYWEFLSGSEFYIPTLLKNGRGYSATKAISEDGLKLSAVAEPESLNLLTEKYHAGYTTDGHSGFFKAPKIPLVGEITCRLTLDTGSVANWVIKDGQTESEFVSVYGENIRIRCDRKSGRLITDSEEALCTPLPFYGIENNLCFTLSVDRGEAMRKLYSLSFCRRIFADASSLSGSVNVFAGSELYPQDIIWNSPENPLYFPEKNRLSLSGHITALSSIGGRLVAFERDSLSCLKANIKPPVSTEFEAPILLITERKSELYRKIISDTVAETEGEIFFCTADGEIFSADSSARLKSRGSLDGFLPRRGVIFGKKYLLIKDQSLYYIDTENPASDKPLLWEMPEEILSAINFSGDTVFYSEDRNGRILAYTLSGEEDNIFGEEIPIECSFHASLYDEPRPCRLYEISILGENRGFNLYISSQGKQLASIPFSAETKSASLSAVGTPIMAEFSFFGGADFKKVGLKFSRLSRL